MAKSGEVDRSDYDFAGHQGNSVGFVVEVVDQVRAVVCRHDDRSGEEVGSEKRKVIVVSGDHEEDYFHGEEARGKDHERGEGSEGVTEEGLDHPSWRDWAMTIVGIVGEKDEGHDEPGGQGGDDERVQLKSVMRGERGTAVAEGDGGDQGGDACDREDGAEGPEPAVIGLVGGIAFEEAALAEEVLESKSGEDEQREGDWEPVGRDRECGGS